MAKLTDIIRPLLTRLIGTSAPLTGGGTLGADRTISIPKATASVDGYLDKTDFSTFNGKQDALGFTATPNTRNVNTTAPIAGGGALSADLTLSMHVSDATHDGYLSSANWATFNGHGALIATNAADIGTLQGTVAGIGSSLGALIGTVSSLSGLVATAVQQATTISTTAPLTGGGDLSANRTFAMPKATALVDGYLAAADFATFSGLVGAVPSSRAVNTSAPLAGGGDLSADRTLSIPAADGSTDGYLTSANWTTFNNKVSTSRSISTTAPLAGGGDLSANRTFSMPVADATHDGYLAQADWGTFNGKQASLGFTPPPNTRSIATTAPLAGGGDLSADRTFSIPAASGSVDGYLTSANWTTFNNKVSTSRSIATTAPITGGGDFSADRTFAIPKATALVDGYLAAADFATFAAGAGVPAGRNINTTAPITGGGDLSADRTLAMAAATDSVAGYMTAADHVILTGKLNKSGGTMTGDLDMGGFRLSTDKITVNQSVISYSATTNIDFDLLSVQTLSLTGNVTFTTSNRAAGRTKRIKILCDGTNRTFTWPAGWTFLGFVGAGTTPPNILSNQTGYLDLICFGTTDATIVAVFTTSGNNASYALTGNNLNDLGSTSSARTNLSVWSKAESLAVANNGSEYASLGNLTTLRSNLRLDGLEDSKSGVQKRSPRGGLQFDGSAGAKITGVAAVNLGLFDFTISLIVKLSTYTSGTQTLFESHNSGNSRIQLQINSSGAVLLLFTNSGASVTTYTLTPDLAFVANDTYDICVTVVRNGSAILFVNGLTDRDNNASQVLTSVASSSAVDIGASNSNPYTVGGSIFGIIHSCKVLRRSLSTAEVLLLARAGITDPVDQWAVVAATYTSDFSVDANGFTSTTGLSALDGNIDGISISAVSKDNNLRLTTNTNNSNHTATKTGVLTIGKRYRVDIVYYIPSSQTTNGVQVAGGAVGVSGTAGTASFQTTGSWQTTFSEFTATGVDLILAGMNGSAVSYTGVAAQVIYINSLILTLVGSILDLDLEKADPSQNLYCQDDAVSNDGLCASATTIFQIKKNRYAPPNVLRNLAAQTINASTTLVDFTGSSIPLLANRTYIIEARIWVTNAGTVAGWKMAVNGPSSPTSVFYGVPSWGNGAAAYGQTSTAFATAVSGGTGSTVARMIMIEGRIENGANAGNVLIQIAQAVSDATNTVFRGDFRVTLLV